MDWIKLKKELDELKAELMARGVNFILTGSVCFHEAGIDFGRDIHDIDIIAIRNAEGYAFADLIEKSQEPLYSPRDAYNMEVGNLKAFRWKGLIVNIFFYDSFEDAEVKAPTFTGSLGIPCRSISEVIAKKKSYSRKKDIEDLVRVVSEILDPQSR